MDLPVVFAQDCVLTAVPRPGALSSACGTVDSPFSVRHNAAEKVAADSEAHAAGVARHDFEGFRYYFRKGVHCADQVMNFTRRLSEETRRWAYGLDGGVPMPAHRVDAPAHGEHVRVCAEFRPHALKLIVGRPPVAKGKPALCGLNLYPVIQVERRHGHRRSLCTSAGAGQDMSSRREVRASFRESSLNGHPSQAPAAGKSPPRRWHRLP